MKCIFCPNEISTEEIFVYFPKEANLTSGWAHWLCAVKHKKLISIDSAKEAMGVW